MKFTRVCTVYVHPEDVPTLPHSMNSGLALIPGQSLQVSETKGTSLTYFFDPRKPRPYDETTQEKTDE
jgi:hypothetical protein